MGSTKTDVLGNLIIGAPSLDKPPVLVVNADSALRGEWVRALEGTFSIRSGREVAPFEEELRRGSFDVLVIGTWHDAFPDQLAKWPRVRVVYVGASVPDGLADASARGLEIAHVARPSELIARVRAFARPRSAMERHPIPGLELRYVGAARGFPVADLSNDGLSFFVEPDDDLDALLPGTVLEEVSLFRDGRIALDGMTAMVRHVAVENTTSPEPGLPAPVPRYRVGCETRDRPREVGPQRRMTLIRDLALSAGLLRASLRGNGILVEPTEGERPGVFGMKGQVDLSTRSFSITGVAHDLEEHEVVRGQFELGGSIYRFTTSVMARLPLTCRLPATLEVCQDRTSGRYSPPVTSPVIVELDSPLLPGPLEREVRDISSTGLSLEIDPLLDLFPPGMRFTLVRMTLGGQTFACRGQVRNLSRVGGREAGLRCGIELDDLDEPTRVRLADVIMRARYPGLRDGCRIAFDDLWAFFRETSFVYAAKQEALAPLMPEIRMTFEAFARRPSHLFKSVVAADQNRLIGHVSGLRCYRRTWMSQHLAGLSGRLAGTLLNLGQAEYFGQNPDLEYHKIFFRPDNAWPARIFGGFARTVVDPRLSDLRTYDYYQLPANWAPITDVGENRVEVIEAAGADLSVVERHFVRTERGVLLRADDLTRDGLGLADLNARYRELGLQRRRRVLLALRRNVPIAFALIEQSSPGLNLSELLSAFQIHMMKDAGPDALAARSALLRASVRVYAQSGRTTAFGLGLPAERDAYATLGAIPSKQYACWTCHRILYMRFSDHVDRIMKTLAARAQRKGGKDEDGSP